MTFKIIAHRGASADAPDNSIEAFRLAIEQGADLIETDVQITQDGVLVLEHDLDVEGHSVANSRFAELLAIKPHLTTLAQTLVVYGIHIPFCWEVKANGTETALVRMVQDISSQNIWEQTEFTSFHWGSALKLRDLAPSHRVGWLTHDWSESAIAKVQSANLSQICPPAQTIIDHPKLVNVAHQAGLQVRAWGMTSTDLIPPLVDAGIYGATVDWTAKARKTLDSTMT
jgi:glycerophosphoryl diester phosphodiesterase